MNGEAIHYGAGGRFEAEFTKRFIDGGSMTKTISFRATDLQAAKDFAHDASFGELVLDLRLKGTEVNNVRVAE